MCGLITDRPRKPSLSLTSRSVGDLHFWPMAFLHLSHKASLSCLHLVGNLDNIASFTNNNFVLSRVPTVD